eukprot:8532423-Ditylum_brightwellii.AAC.1
MATGMSRHLGTVTTHCLALHLEHTTFNHSYRETKWNGTTSNTLQYKIAAAQSFELFAWLGWPRGQENLSL